eukprot:2995710-Amphidinium_carterae.1
MARDRIACLRLLEHACAYVVWHRGVHGCCVCVLVCMRACMSHVLRLWGLNPRGATRVDYESDVMTATL